MIKDFLFVDTETTNLLQPMGNTLDFQPWMFEINITRTNEKLAILDQFETLISIPVQIPRHITAITSVSDFDLQGKKPFKKHIKSIEKICKGSGYFIAHNATFDYTMLEIEGKRNDFVFSLPERKICLVEQSLHLMGYRLSQGELWETLHNQPLPRNRHRAGKDVKTMIENFETLFGGNYKCLIKAIG